MSLAFLTPGAGAGAPPAESPLAAATAAAGAIVETRDGWRVPVRFDSPRVEELALAQRVGWSDVSHLRKVELQGQPEAISTAVGGTALGWATASGDGWACPVTPTRALLLGGARVDPDHPGLHALDVTTQLAALRVAGPLARETLARFCALDLRPRVAPPPSFRPGSVARTPGLVLCEASDQYLIMVGAALGEYLWSVVTDAGTSLGGRPVGVDAPFATATERQEAGSHA